MFGTSPTRVLIADDHLSFTEVVRAMLEGESSIEVVGAAADGQVAVELARELEPHVILMDISMPRLDGFEATRRIVAERPDALVVMLTGSDAPEDLERARRAGAVGYLTKDQLASDLMPTLLGLTKAA